MSGSYSHDFQNFQVKFINVQLFKQFFSIVYHLIVFYFYFFILFGFTYQFFKYPYKVFAKLFLKYYISSTKQWRIILHISDWHFLRNIVIIYLFIISVLMFLLLDFIFTVNESCLATKSASMFYFTFEDIKKLGCN